MRQAYSIYEATLLNVLNSIAMNRKVARMVAIVLAASFLFTASSCATRPRKCDGRRGIMTPMGVM